MVKHKGCPAYIYRAINTVVPNSKFEFATAVIVIHELLPEVDLQDIFLPAVRIVETREFDELSYHAEPLEPGNYSYSGMFIYLDQKDFHMIFKHPIPLWDVTTYKQPEREFNLLG